MAQLNYLPTRNRALALASLAFIAVSSWWIARSERPPLEFESYGSRKKVDPIDPFHSVGSARFPVSFSDDARPANTSS